MNNDSKEFSNSYHPDPLPLELIHSILESEAPHLWKDIKVLHPNPFVASLSQVHCAELKDGQFVAVKIQFPDLQTSLDEQFTVLKKALQISPAMKYGFQVDDFIQYFHKSLLTELDYLQEAQTQKKVFQHFTKNQNIIIPKIYSEFSSEKVLTQSYESGVKIQDLLSLNDQSKSDCATFLTDFILESLFKLQLIHGDLQPQNWVYRPSARQLVIYDFGSCVFINSMQALSLRQLIQATKENHKKHALDSLIAMGFDSEKIHIIENRILDLLRALLNPLFEKTLWNANEWKLGARLDEILGADKWWFRTAGPPWFLHLMRTIGYWALSLQKLNVSIPLQDIFEKISPSEIIESTDVTATRTQPLDSTQLSSIFSLHVSVKENEQEIVKVSLPAHAIDDIEFLLSTETQKKIQEQGQDIFLIKKKVQESGYIPQLVLDIKSSPRSYKVWIE